MDQPDLKQLEDGLYRYGLAGFRRVRAAHPNDHFYSFAFYTSGSYSYVVLTASTHEGLDTVARKYKATTHYKAMSTEELAINLKWSPCDSPLHCDDELTPLRDRMRAVAAELTRRFDLDDGSRSYDEFKSRVDACFAEALKRIDAEGVFGRDEERKDVVVNLLMGDQSDEARLAFARRVNPPESVKMLERDLSNAAQLRR